MENGNLIHTKSGKCAKPKGAVADGVVLGLYSSCGGHQFSFTAGGSLQHVGSKKCVNPKTGVSVNAKWWFEMICISKQTLIYFLLTMIWLSFTYDLPLFMCESSSSRSVILILFYGQFST